MLLLADDVWMWLCWSLPVLVLVDELLTSWLGFGLWVAWSRRLWFQFHGLLCFAKGVLTILLLFGGGWFDGLPLS